MCLNQKKHNFSAGFGGWVDHVFMAYIVQKGLFLQKEAFLKNW